jgi:hypothetical protein
MTTTYTPIALAITHHDPGGVLYSQLEHHLPGLSKLFAGIAANVSPETHAPSLALLQGAGVKMQVERREETHDGMPQLGKVRRAALALALQLETPFLMYCDGDRLLHWLANYPSELAAVLARLPAADFTILGRTRRAFASHPAIQYDTEQIINRVYASISGRSWDITAGARGLSRRVAQAIVHGCLDDSTGVDAAWPLFLQRAGHFSIDEIQTEGLQFETADQYPSEVAALGGESAWKAQLDATPRHWLFRLRLAHIEVLSMLPYAEKL